MKWIQKIGVKNIRILLVVLFLVVTVFIISRSVMPVYAMKPKVDLNLEKQIVSGKVSQIMALFGCTDPVIHESIMQTFDPVLVSILIAIESEYNPDAVSSAGCRGLTQLSPGKLEDWKDVRKNVQIGAGYLEKQVARFGNLEMALAAYNAGPESVVKYGGVPPYEETLAFITKAKIFSLMVDKPLEPQTTKIKQGAEPYFRLTCFYAVSIANAIDTAFLLFDTRLMRFHIQSHKSSGRKDMNHKNLFFRSTTGIIVYAKDLFQINPGRPK